MRGRAYAGCVLLAVTVALGACGGGTTGQIMAGSGLPSAAGDAAMAQRVVLSVADLPGFRAEPPPAADASSAQAAATFQQCLGAGVLALGDAGRTAQSPGFRKGTTVSVSSLATLVPSEGAAQAAMADLSRHELEPCVTGLLRAVLERDLKLPVTSAISELLPAGTAGEESLTWRTILQVTSGGQALAAYSDLTFVRSGRVLASLFDFQLGEPFPAPERNRLAGAMAARMANV